jgi:hypothetical protein
MIPLAFSFLFLSPHFFSTFYYVYCFVLCSCHHIVCWLCFRYHTSFSLCKINSVTLFLPLTPADHPRDLSVPGSDPSSCLCRFLFDPPSPPLGIVSSVSTHAYSRLARFLKRPRYNCCYCLCNFIPEHDHLILRKNVKAH